MFQKLYLKLQVGYLLQWCQMLYVAPLFKSYKLLYVGKGYDHFPTTCTYVGK